MKYLFRIQAYYNAAVIVAGAFYLIGIIGLAWLGHIPGVWYATGPFLILTILLLLAFHENPGKKDIFPSLFAFLAGFTAEWLGTNTGWPFGEYSYGSILGPALWNTPLLIGFNWLLLTYVVRVWLLQLKITSWLSVLFGAVILLVYDYLLEPVAIFSKMWTWANGTPPLQNYAGWMGLSLLILAIYQLTDFRPRNRMAPWILLFQSLFFGILRFLVQTHYD